MSRLRGRERFVRDRFPHARAGLLAPEREPDPTRRIDRVERAAHADGREITPDEPHRHAAVDGIPPARRIDPRGTKPHLAMEERGLERDAPPRACAIYGLRGGVEPSEPIPLVRGFVGVAFVIVSGGAVRPLRHAKKSISAARWAAGSRPRINVTGSPRRR